MVVIRRANGDPRRLPQRKSAELSGREVVSTDMIGSSTAQLRPWGSSDKVTKSNGPRHGARASGAARKRRALISTSANSQPRFGTEFLLRVNLAPTRCAGAGLEECGCWARNPERRVEPGLLEQAHGGVIFLLTRSPIYALGYAMKIPAGAWWISSFTRGRKATTQVRVDLRV